MARVLVVDDAAFMRVRAVKVLEDNGHEVAQAENAVSQFPPRQGPAHRLGEHVMMPCLVHQSAVEEDEFQTPSP